jgi:hypothetical protein
MASLSDEIEARLGEKTRQLAETMGWSYDDAKRTVYSALNAEFFLAEMSARAGSDTARAYAAPGSLNR